MYCNDEKDSAYGSMASLATLSQSDSVSEYGSVSTLSYYGSMSTLHKPDNLSIPSRRVPNAPVNF